MKLDNGFTLIEIMLSIVIIGLIVTALFNINIAGWRFLAYNQDRVKVQRQARLIDMNLEKNIRRATDVKLIDSDSDNIYEEIILKYWDTDNDSNINYARYLVDSNVFKEFNADIDSSLDWPSNADWNLNRNLTDNIIISYNFGDNDGGNNGSNVKSIYFKFSLNIDKSSYDISNRFHPRAIN